MKKRYIATIVALVMILSLFWTSAAIADEKLVWPSYNRGALNYTEGTVISRNASVRANPDESAKKICNVYNGQYLKVTGVVGNWYVVDLACLDNPKGYATGYILSYYVLTDYQCVYLKEGAPIYPYPNASKRIGYLPSGSFYTILGETSECWIINARTAAAYLPKNVSTYTSSEMEYYYTGMTRFEGYTLTNSVKVYSGPGTDYKKIDTFKKDVAVSVIGYQGDFYCIIYNDDGANIIGYVKMTEVKIN